MPAVPGSARFVPPALGCMRLSTAADRDDERSVALLHEALDAGVRFLDTADVYCRDESEIGHNERLIARALGSWTGDGSSVTVATKGGLTRPGGGWVPDGRARPSRRRVRSEPPRPGRRAPVPLPAPRPRPRCRPCHERARPRATPEGRARRGDRALERDGGPDPGGGEDRADRGGAGGALPLARRQPPERRRRVLPRPGHPDPRLPAARGPGAATPHPRGSRPAEGRRPPRRDAVRDRPRLAPRPLAARACRSPAPPGWRRCGRSSARPASSWTRRTGGSSTSDSPREACSGKSPRRDARPRAATARSFS